MIALGIVAGSGLKVLRSRRTLLLLALSLVLISGLWGVWLRLEVIRDWRYATSLTDAVIDEDTGWSIEGVERAAHFRDTLKWWSGPWVQEPYRLFYRPLTSMSWWLQYQAFGRQGLQGFMSVHLLSHLVLLVIAWYFLGELLGYRLATLATVIHALFANEYFGFPAAHGVLSNWKDSAEIWMAIAYVATLIFFLRFLCGRGNVWYLWALGGLLVAIGFKEMSYTLPTALLVLAWYKGKLRSHWHLVVPFFLIVVCAFIFRWWALEGYGTRIGSNNAWFWRAIMANGGGTAMAFVIRGDIIPLGLALLGWASWLALSPERRRGALLLAVGGAFAVLLTHFTLPLEDISPLWRLFIFEPWRRGLYTAAMLWMGWRFLKNRWRVQVFAYALAVVTYLPLLTTPLPGRGDYLVSLGWSLWLACALVDCGSLSHRWILSKFPEWRERLVKFTPACV